MELVGLVVARCCEGSNKVRHNVNRIAGSDTLVTLSCTKCAREGRHMWEQVIFMDTPDFNTDEEVL